MKFTVAFIGLLSLSVSWADMSKKVEEKDKREAPLGYPSSGHASHTLQIQQNPAHDDGNAISIGAGYSVGGAKPIYSFDGQSAGQAYHFGQGGTPSSEGHTIQLAPITLQPEHGNLLSSGDLSQLMSQLSHGLSTGSLTLQSPGGGSYHSGGQQLTLKPQFAYAASSPMLQQYSVTEQSHGSAPSYSTGTKGLSSYGSTGPVLFNPADNHGAQSFSYGAPSPGHSFSDSGHALAGLSLNSLSGGHSFGGQSFGGQSFGGQSFGGHPVGGYSLSGGPSLSGHSFGPQPSSGGHSLGGYSLGSQSLSGNSQSGHSFPSFPGSSGSYKAFSSHGGPSKTFKPSAFLGSSVGDLSHGSSGLSPSYGTPSFAHSLSSSGHGGLSLNSGHGPLSLSSSGHGPSFGASFGGFNSGSSKFSGAPSYLPPKAEGFGATLESINAFASNGHLASGSPGATYGSPSTSFAHSNAQAAHSSPQYYITPAKHSSSSSFGEGGVSYKGPLSGSSSSSSLSSSPSPKFSVGGHSGSSSRYAAPKDSHGAYSEHTYNTIKYSEELKPRSH